MRSFKSSEHINEKGDGPYRGFGYSSLLYLFTCHLDWLLTSVGWHACELGFRCVASEEAKVLPLFIGFMATSGEIWFRLAILSK